MSDTESPIVLATLRLIDGHILEALYSTRNGVVKSQLDLNSHIQNDNGQLRWFGSGYFQSSSSEHLFGIGLLRASCEKLNGPTVKGEINLNEHIKINSAGRLVYF